MSFPFYKQLDAMDCGPTSLRIVAAFYGRKYTLQTLREKCHITREGVSMLGISDAAEAIGFRTTGVKLTYEQLCKDITLPCIIHWNQNHFVVLYKVKKEGEGLRIPHFRPGRRTAEIQGRYVSQLLAFIPGRRCKDRHCLVA